MFKFLLSSYISDSWSKISAILHFEASVNRSPYKPTKWPKTCRKEKSADSKSVDQNLTKKAADVDIAHTSSMPTEIVKMIWSALSRRLTISPPEYTQNHLNTRCVVVNGLIPVSCIEFFILRKMYLFQSLLTFIRKCISVLMKQKTVGKSFWFTKNVTVICRFKSTISTDGLY